MKVIEITHPIQNEQFIKENVAMVLGFFDDMHRGHSKVSEALDIRVKKKNLKKAVATFDPRPSVVLSPERKYTGYLTPLSDKLEMTERHDIDYCIVINFSSRFASVTAEEFIKDYIINNRAKEVAAGFSFTFGKSGGGSMAALNEIGEFNTTTVGKLDLDSERISTTSIRQVLYEGNLQEANDELGYLYRIKDTVVRGEKRGRTIGFPAASVRPNDDYVLPKKGVYAVNIGIGAEHKTYREVANVGVKPTFHDPSKAEVVIEVSIFDFKENVYGGRVIVYWHHYLGPEVRFDGIDALVSQMNDDGERVEYLLAVDFGDDVLYSI